MTTQGALQNFRERFCPDFRKKETCKDQIDFLQESTMKEATEENASEIQNRNTKCRMN